MLRDRAMREERSVPWPDAGSAGRGGEPAAARQAAGTAKAIASTRSPAPRPHGRSRPVRAVCAAKVRCPAVCRGRAAELMNVHRGVSGGDGTEGNPGKARARPSPHGLRPGKRIRTRMEITMTEQVTTRQRAGGSGCRMAASRSPRPGLAGPAAGVTVIGRDRPS